MGAESPVNKISNEAVNISETPFITHDTPISSKANTVIQGNLNIFLANVVVKVLKNS